MYPQNSLQTLILCAHWETAKLDNVHVALEPLEQTILEALWTFHSNVVCSVHASSWSAST